MRIPLTFGLFLLCLSLFAPACIYLEEYRAVKNIKSQKVITDWDFATADFYIGLCKQKKLVSSTCSQAQQALKVYKNCNLAIKILGF